MSTAVEERKRGRQTEWISRSVFTLCAATVVAVLVIVFLFVGLNAYQTFTVYHISPLEFFFGTKYNPDDGKVGALIPIAGSFLLTICAVLLSAPISVGIAIFVTEVAPPWARRIMQPVLELLTGIPSIIFGLLALQILVPLMAGIYNTIAGGFFYNGFGIVAAAIVLALMILPTITTISIDYLAALPTGLREASLALGATRWQSIRRTLLPASSAGIFTGIVLGMGRAIGETLAVAFVIGGSANRFPFGWTEQFPFIKFFPTSTITVQLLFDFKEAINPSLTYSVVWTLSFVLLLISFLFVLVSRAIASRSVYNTATIGKTGNGANKRALNVLRALARKERIMATIANEGQVAQPKAQPDAKLTRRARARLADRIATGVLWGIAIGVAAVLLYIILYMLVKGLGVLSWKFVTYYDQSMQFVGAEVFNSFYIVVLALLICLPLAIGASIYLVEYARQGPFTRILRFATETLSGVPSLILGLFGFLVFVTHFGSGRFMGLSRLAGALTLVMLNLPLLLRVSEDALRSVPNDLREASVALGANKFRTVWRVLIPTALPALTTGVILTAGKMIGETAALIYTAGSNVPVNGWFTLDPLVPGETLTVLLYQTQAEGLTHNAIAIENGTATLLVLFLLIFNLGLRWLAGALSRRLSGRR